MKDKALYVGALLFSLMPDLADRGSDATNAAASGAGRLDRVPFALAHAVPPTAQRCN